MILSDSTISTRLLYDSTFNVKPQPDSEQIQPASLDVRLGEQFVDADGRPFECEHAVDLVPGKRLLATTKEKIELPNDVAAQLAGRSTVARRGIIIHKTAGWIDPGFEGEITLELCNMGRENQMLGVGDRVAQLVFYELDQPSSGYDGKYQNQEGATEARADD
jgi:dCTP deaminase